MKIVLLDGYELNRDLNWKLLRELGDCSFYNRTSEDNNEILERISDAEIVITHKTPLNEYVIGKAHNLKYIGIMGTGYDVVDINSAHKIILLSPTFRHMQVMPSHNLQFHYYSK